MQQWGNMVLCDIIKKKIINQNQQMRAQKNRKDVATTEPHPTENEVNFELLWRCISKFPNQQEGGA